jgi:hypothetical protein
MMRVRQWEIGSNSLLRDEVVVHQEIIVQCLFEFGGARKASLLAKLLSKP